MTLLSISFLMNPLENQQLGNNSSHMVDMHYFIGATTKLYTCANCHITLSSRDEVVSKSFHSQSGRGEMTSERVDISTYIKGMCFLINLFNSLFNGKYDEY